MVDQSHPFGGLMASTDWIAFPCSSIRVSPFYGKKWDKDGIGTTGKRVVKFIKSHASSMMSFIQKLWITRLLPPTFCYLTFRGRSIDCLKQNYRLILRWELTQCFSLCISARPFTSKDFCRNISKFINMTCKISLDFKSTQRPQAAFQLMDHNIEFARSPLMRKISYPTKYLQCQSRVNLWLVTIYHRDTFGIRSEMHLPKTICDQYPCWNAC